MNALGCRVQRIISTRITYSASNTIIDHEFSSGDEADADLRVMYGGGMASDTSVQYLDGLSTDRMECYRLIDIRWIIEDLDLNDITMMSHGDHGVSNHRQLAFWFNSLFRLTTKKTLKLRITGLCEGNPADSTNIHVMASSYRQLLPRKWLWPS